MKKFWLFSLLAGVLTLLVALFLANHAVTAAKANSLSVEQILAESYHSVQFQPQTSQLASSTPINNPTLSVVSSSQNVPSAQAAPTDNSACLSCHGNPGMQTKLPNGDILYLTVDQKTFDSSVHGQKGLSCTQCHTSIKGYPHDPLPGGIVSRRDVTIWFYQSCTQCHTAEKAAMTNDAHQIVLSQGNQNAAVCTDCHGAHDVKVPNQPRSQIPQTCQKCHSQIYDLYKDSVHGAALIGDGNPDVPSCVDCHSSHNVQGPINTQFRLFSPQICARCHANEQLMAKYGINTDVFNTYVADFHGTTVEMFQAVAPGQETNKPVCIDCHGVHDIKSTSDPNSTVIKDNLLKTCQKCHPGASPNFPAAWLSHYQPSPQHYPVVYYVNVFYKFFIPGVLGIMGLFVVTDIGRRAVNKGKSLSRKSRPPKPAIPKTQVEKASGGPEEKNVGSKEQNNG